MLPYYCRCLVIVCTFSLYSNLSTAQFFDSLQARAGLQYRFSSKDHLPFWLISNQFGTVSDQKYDLTSFVSIANKHVIAGHEYQNDHGLYDYNDLTLSYGVSIYNNNHFKSTFPEEGYVKLEYKNWSLRAGRFEETTGDLDARLSTGSFGVSGNALPIPKIGIAVTDYTNIPFTSGWLQFKGTFAHGWLGNNRYIKNSYYHEKTFFLRIGPRNLKFYAGIEHFGEWGGSRSDQQFDRSVQGFWNVVLARETDNINSETNGGVHAGDHRGVLDGGVYWENDNTAIHGYLQKPFEGKKDIDLHNKNMLAGFTVTMKNNTRLEKVLFEFVSTRSINNNIPGTEQESYYNNSVYKTGWEYENNIIGTPLFLNRTRASKYFPKMGPFDWNVADTSIPGNANIINNRVFAIHAGAIYTITEVVGAKTLLTYTKNYGSLNNTLLFAPGKKQFYGLQEVYFKIPDKNLTVKAAIGIDVGQLTSVTGLLFGIEWSFSAHKNMEYNIR